MPVPPAVSEPRGYLQDRVRERVCALILGGALVPGEQINSLEVARWLNVSRTPIHRALGRLELAGLIETRGHRFRVVEVDPGRIPEHLYTLGVMRAGAVRLALPALTGQAIAIVAGSVDRVQDALALGDMNRYESAAAELWQHFIDVAGNRSLQQLYAGTSLGLCFKTRLAAGHDVGQLSAWYEVLRDAVRDQSVDLGVHATEAIHASYRHR